MQSDRQYIVLRSDARGEFKYESTSSDSYQDKRVRHYDRMLHQTLRKIFHERRLTSNQIKEFLGQNSLLKLILKREPALIKAIPKKNKMSLLWTAVMCCYQNSAELLVHSGADVNELHGQLQVKNYEFDLHDSLEKLNEKTSLLHVLLQMYPSQWNERFIRLVINQGADLKAQDCHGRTVLHWAVRNGRVRETKLLLERGADVNAKDVIENTAVLEAACTPEAEMLMPLLLNHGADITVTNVLCRNVLDFLASAPEENVNLAKYLIRKGASLGANSSDVWSHQPIFEAVQLGKNELVKLFLDHGVDVNARDNWDGDFPLCYAAQDHPAASSEMTLTLLKRGADIDMRTVDDQSTALHIASSYFDLEKIKVLLSAGADVIAEDIDGNIPFEVMIDEMNDREIGPYMENPSVKLMLKTLALRMSCLPSTIKVNVEQPFDPLYQEHSDYYDECKASISKAKSTRFIKTCTVFDLLTKCHCEIAVLMRNRTFEEKFRLQDLGIFSMYAEDILEAFERAKRFHQSLRVQEDIIVDAVDDIFPYEIVKKIAYNSLTCEECELKKIVRASRSGSVKFIV